MANVGVGWGAENVFRRLAYTDTQGSPTIAAVPLAALPETTRVELRPASTPALLPAGMVGTGHAFDLVAFNGGPESEWTEPVELVFGGLLPAALVEIHYSDADVTHAQAEGWIKLVRKTAEGWVDATCPGLEGQVIRSPGANWLLIPVCQTGSYALLQPGDLRIGYLPMLQRGSQP